MTRLQQETRKFLEKLARRLLAADYDSAGKLLAPWLDSAGLADEIRRQINATREMFEDEHIGDPDSWELDDSPVSLAELREEGVPLPAQVTDSDFRGYFGISIMADDEEWSLYDLWCAVVDTHVGLAVGYYEITAPD